MKITKRQLRRIIKEEKAKIVKEQSDLSRLFPIGRMAASLSEELHRLMAAETGEDMWYQDAELMQVAQDILDQVKKVH